MCWCVERHCLPVVCGRRPCGCVMLLEECQVTKAGMEKCLSCVVWGVWRVLKCMGEVVGKMWDAVETESTPENKILTKVLPNIPGLKTINPV